LARNHGYVLLSIFEAQSGLKNAATSS
jgi:hypothetical protein